MCSTPQFAFRIRFTPTIRAEAVAIGAGLLAMCDFY